MAHVLTPRLRLLSALVVLSLAVTGSIAYGATFSQSSSADGPFKRPGVRFPAGRRLGHLHDEPRYPRDPTGDHAQRHRTGSGHVTGRTADRVLIRRQR